MQDEDNRESEDLSNFVTVDGVLIKQDFDHLIMEENEVDKYTSLQSATMQQTLYVPYPHDIQVLAYFLYSYYAQVEVEYTSNASQDSVNAAKPKYDLVFKVEGQIEIAYFKKSELLQVSWETSPKNDLVADSVCLLVLQIKEHPTP